MAPITNSFKNLNIHIKNRFGIDLLSYRTLVYGICTYIMFMGAYVIGGTEYGTWMIAGLVGMIVSLVVMIRPHIGMYILLAFIYTNASVILTEAFGLPSTNKPLVALIFVSVIGTQILMRRKPLVFRLSEFAIVLHLVAVAIASVLGAGLNPVSFDDIVDYGKDFLIVFIIVQLASEEKVWKRSQIMLIVVCVFVSSLTWYQFFTNDFTNDFYGLATSRTDSVGDSASDIDFYRVGGPVGDPNFYAQTLIMIFPIALFRFLDKNASDVEKLFGAISTIIIVGAIIFTYSRASLLVLIVITGLILLERRINIFKAGVVGILVLALVFPTLPQAYKERMLTIIGISSAFSTGNSADVSTQGRLSEAIAAIQMFVDHPFFGVGYAGYESNYLDYSVYLGLDARLEERQAHNYYLEQLAETGIVGFSALVFMLWVLYTTSQRARATLPEIGREDLLPWIAALQFGLLAYLLNSMFLHDSYIRYMRMSIALLVSATALVEALVAEQKAQIERKRIAQFDVELIQTS